ncbi:MAG: hypothetical protein MUF33_04800 [Candidatus Nanopelagicales bacterium]|nr:hypothetical protein [Candidatus Nanopelagicales bacterium]
MKITFAAVAAALVAPAILAAPASASTDTVKVKVAIDNCTNCTVMATWSKKATLNSRGAEGGVFADVEAGAQGNERRLLLHDRGEGDH